MGTPPPPTNFRLQLIAFARFSFGDIQVFRHVLVTLVKSKLRALLTLIAL